MDYIRFVSRGQLSQRSYPFGRAIDALARARPMPREAVGFLLFRLGGRPDARVFARLKGAQPPNTRDA